MPTSTTIADDRRLDAVRLREHPDCVACSASNALGLKLRCRVTAPGRVEACFTARSWMAGYPGCVHGGVVSALLDSAMTQCLFAHAASGVTAVLRVRFRRPVPLNRQLDVAAWIERRGGRQHRLRARLCDAGVVLADAEALFVRRD